MEGGVGLLEWGEGSLYGGDRFQLWNESDVRNKRYLDTCGTACQRRLTLAEYLRFSLLNV